MILFKAKLPGFAFLLEYTNFDVKNAQFFITAY